MDESSDSNINKAASLIVRQIQEDKQNTQNQ